VAGTSKISRLPVSAGIGFVTLRHNIQQINTNPHTQDVGNSWYLANYPTTLLTSIMDQYINQTQTLYDLAGARSFLFLTVPPIQLSPTVLAQGAENVAAEGKAVAQYNEALTKRVEAFAKANVGVKVTVVDTTKPFMEAIEDPKAFGAENATCFDASGTKCLWWNDVSLPL
jgi:phospholipase/lecithinase/hemolysin